MLSNQVGARSSRGFIIKSLTVIDIQDNGLPDASDNSGPNDDLQKTVNHLIIRVDKLVDTINKAEGTLRSGQRDITTEVNKGERKLEMELREKEEALSSKFTEGFNKWKEDCNSRFETFIRGLEKKSVERENRLLRRIVTLVGVLKRVTYVQFC